MKILFFLCSKQLSVSFPPENVANCEVINEIWTDVHVSVVFDNFERKLKLVKEIIKKITKEITKTNNKKKLK